MQTIYSIFLALHIAGGFLALTIGLVAMLTAKGSKTHKMSGKLYVFGMTAACASAFYMAIAKPNLFLFIIGVFSYQLVGVGYRTLYRKKFSKPAWIDWIIGLVPALFSALMIGLGVLTLMRGNMFGITSLIFGSIGMTIAIRWLRSFYVTPKEKGGWLFTHFQSMGGAYIATTTAFLVVNVHVLPPVLLWLTPTVVGSVIITFVTAKYKRRQATKHLTLQTSIN
jgi:uncharacterized membrane protein